MQSLLLKTAGAACFVLTASTVAHAQDCTFDPDKDFFDFEQAEVDALYSCVSDRLAEAYAKEGDEIGTVYRDWGVTATGPAAPGAHSNRFLLTFANDVAYETYVQYGFGDDFSMPVGSVLAKESYSLTKEGEPRPGPLFIMTKVEAGGEAEEFGNWVYSAVRTNGKPMGIQQGFCHGCHSAFADQDSMGYPDRDVRFETN
ncbi:Cytochrome P460 [Cognatiyoonia koreensis]|uniref:Cytochrome P460 n=1 Tax=Cognatiyoonia koreensis TaxID=364200 RepID=A0A1I0PQZ6_9RHOB|nr:cytochrome P460 family protein [Cognatiyoonia koreensis]SEW16268.1 Cytochrome P460 [Cognatiyoonia koreensis]